MPTVIDQFVVKYVIDTKDLDKGLEKAKKKVASANAKIVESSNALSQGVSKSATKATNSLGLLGSVLGKGGVIGLALGSLVFIGKKLDDAMFGVAQSLRKLGIESKNLGIASKDMRNLQYASELAGGSLEDASKDVDGLSKSLFNLKFNGQVSDSLVMLSRLGVHFQDSYGRARDFKDVMLDTATAIEKAKQAGRMTDAEGYQFALQAGFSGGDANLVNNGVASFKAAMAKQESRRQVQGKDIAAGTRAVNASISLGQATEANIKNAGMDLYGNTRGAGQEKLESAAVYTANAVSHMGDVVNKIFSPSTGGGRGSNRGGFTGGGSVGSTSKFTGKSTVDPSVSIGLRNNNPLNLMARRDRNGRYLDPHDDKGFRVFGSMDEGLAAADSQLALYSKRGNNTLGGMISTWAPHKDKNGKVINDTEAYIADVSKRTGIGRNQVVGEKERSSVVAAMARHDSGYIVPDKSSSGASTSVQIDNITINTQATDARGIASSIGGELSKRKLLAAHAETGPN